MRKISTKNYVIYTIIVLITIAVVIFLSKWYEIKKDGQTTHRMNSIAEIKETDLDNYLVENPSIIIYLSNSHKEELKDFESEFNKYILKNNLNKKMIYIDLNGVSENFDKKLKNKLGIDSSSSYLNVNFSEDENIIIIEDSQLVSILYNTGKNINMDDVKVFLRGNRE